jgi:hypothetical protein
MRKTHKVSIIVASAVVTGAGLLAASAADHNVQSETMHHFEDQSVIDGAAATLARNDHGVFMSVDTVGLTPGHAVTMWYVVFNDPDRCSGEGCGEDDVFNLDADGKFIDNADGSPPMNMDAIKDIGISVLRADGLIIDADGRAQFRGHLPVGDKAEAVFGPGLLDAQRAEVHAVVRSHMQAIPGQANAMVNSMNGGCDETWPNAPCTDLQYAVFKPQAVN